MSEYNEIEMTNYTKAFRYAVNTGINDPVSFAASYVSHGATMELWEYAARFVDGVAEKGSGQ